MGSKSREDASGSGLQTGQCRPYRRRTGACTGRTEWDLTGTDRKRTGSGTQEKQHSGDWEDHRGFPWESGCFQEKAGRGYCKERRTVCKAERLLPEQRRNVRAHECSGQRSLSSEWTEEKAGRQYRRPDQLHVGWVWDYPEWCGRPSQWRDEWSARHETWDQRSERWDPEVR